MQSNYLAVQYMELAYDPLNPEYVMPHETLIKNLTGCDLDQLDIEIIGIWYGDNWEDLT